MPAIAPRISLMHFWDSWDIVTQTLISTPEPECACSDCREAREISSMERLYPEGRIPLSIIDDEAA